MNKRFLIVALLIALISIIPISADETVRERFVFDDADILSFETERKIDTYSSVLRSQFDLELIVATTSDIGHYGIERYAADLYESLELDHSETNNSILLVLAPKDKDYCVLEGKGIAGSITSYQLDEMLWEHLEEPFCSGDYDFGVQQVYDVLYGRITDIYGGAGAEKAANPLLWAVILLALILIAAIIALLLMRRRARILAQRRREKARRLHELKRRNANYTANHQSQYRDQQTLPRDYAPPRRYDNLPRR